MSGGGRILSAQDRILWSTVARTVTPLKGKRIDPEPQPQPAGADQPPKLAAEADVRTALPVRRKVSTLAALDRRQREKIAKGKVAIEGRIDLHGMTQRDAHALLLGFLRRAHSEGRRHVLVITGKGASLGSEGALRRAVPHWLATPDFRPFVGGWSEAMRSHGGEGALYVRIARKRSSVP